MKSSKVLFDTSVLVAAMVSSHPAHRRSLLCLQQAIGNRFEIHVCAHTLAELYAVLTRLPLSPKISPALARRLIRKNVEDIAKIVRLDGAEYGSMLDEVSELGLIGGVVYDAIIAFSAKKAGVDYMLTLNEADFRRVWPDAGAKIKTA